MTGPGGGTVHERTPGQRPPDTGTAEPNGPEPERPDESDALDRVLAEARSVGRDLLDLVRLGVDRARLGARSGAFRLLVLAWVGLAGATATVIAALFVVEGLAGLATEAFDGRVWAGRLAAGALVLVAGAVVIRLQRGRSRRAALKRLEARYAEREPAKDRGETG